jgi:hypothetical protein
VPRFKTLDGDMQFEVGKDNRVSITSGDADPIYLDVGAS